MRTTQLVTRLELFGLMICGLLLSSPSYSQFPSLDKLLDKVVDEVGDVLGDQSDQSDQSDQEDQSDRNYFGGQSRTGPGGADMRECFESEDDREYYLRWESAVGVSEEYRFGAELCEGTCDSGDCVNGQGTYTFPDGDQYVGEWRDGEMHGQGSYANQNRYTNYVRDTYVGEWRDGLANGQGTKTYSSTTPNPADGRVETGIWEDGALVPIVYESFLAEFEATNSGTDFAMYLVFAEKCGDEFLLSGAVLGSLVEAFEGMIRRGIDEERFTGPEVSEAVRQNNTILSGGMNFEQQQLCEVLGVIETQFFPPPDRF